MCVCVCVCVCVWLLGTYIPRKEVVVLETVKATVIRENQAIRLRARKEGVDRGGVHRVTGMCTHTHTRICVCVCVCVDPDSICRRGVAGEEGGGVSPRSPGGSPGYRQRFHPN